MSFVHAAGLDFEVLEAGSGPPVVLVHSTGLSARQWRYALRSLSGRFHMLAPNLVGYGASSPLPPGDFDVELDIAGVRAVLAQLDQPAHLVGHSYGAFVALQAAQQSLESVRSLTLMEPVSFGILRSDGDPDVLAEMATLDAHAEFWELEHAGSDAWLRGFTDYWNTPGAWANLLDRQKTALSKVATKMFWEVQACWFDPRPLELYSALNRPVTLVRGENTTLAVKRAVQLLEGALPQARTLLVEDAGHMFPLTRPVRTLELMEAVFGE